MSAAVPAPRLHPGGGEDRVPREGSLTDKPLYDLTRTLLDCVRDHDLASLSRMCDDDYGIVEITMTGGSLVIRDRQAWVEWFTSLFAELDAAGARTWSEISGYDVYMGQDLAYSVVDFDQVLVTPQEALRFSVVATIIWKLVDGQWKESRYHSSLVGVAPTSIAAA